MVRFLKSSEDPQTHRGSSDSARILRCNEDPLRLQRSSRVNRISDGILIYYVIFIKLQTTLLAMQLYYRMKKNLYKVSAPFSRKRLGESGFSWLRFCDASLEQTFFCFSWTDFFFLFFCGRTCHLPCNSPGALRKLVNDFLMTVAAVVDGDPAAIIDYRWE